MTAIAMIAGEGHAQSDSRIKKAQDNLDIVMAVLSRAVLANNLCTKGSNKNWFLAIAAIDQRYAFCVKQDQRWSALEIEWMKEKKEAEAIKMKEPGIGTFAYMRAMTDVPAEIQTTGGAEAFCARTAWDLLLDAEAATPEKIAEFKRTHPRIDIEETIKVFNVVRNLGIDRRWIDTPCDQEFWPAATILSRR